MRMLVYKPEVDGSVEPSNCGANCSGWRRFTASNASLHSFAEESEDFDADLLSLGD